MFISSQRIVGCLLAEPIKKAFKILSCLVDGASDGTTIKEAARPLSNLAMLVLKGKSGKKPPLLIVLRSWIGISMEQSFAKMKLYLLLVELEPFGSLPLTEENT